MELDEILLRIGELIQEMAGLWDEKGKTGPEILAVSIRIDELLNQYYRLLS